jgi:hypothetical protein
MPLSQADRIAISKKIISIPLQNAASDTITAQIDVEKQKAQKEDDANKTLMNDVSVYVNGYQSELQRYDGNGRTQLLEQDLLDSANRTLRNNFFPNDPQTPLPSVADGVWKNFIVFSGNAALGKNYAETYTIVTKEQDLINDINAKIAVVEAFSNITRSTGQSCAATGTCSLPIYTTQPTCVSHSGIWTAGPDFIGTDAAMQTAATNLITAIQTWETFILGTDATVMTTDTDATRSPQNLASRADIANSVSIINTWQARPSFDTTHGQTTCSGFNSYNVNLLAATKFRAAELAAIKNEITARQIFITTRMSQLNTNLGTIVQDMSNGNFTTVTGFYGQRVRIIDTRLNAMGGSLSKLQGLIRGQNAQAQAKISNDNTALVYTSVMVASAFKAPATDNPTIHVLSSVGFSVSDAVYVTAENKDEIATTIVSISGNAITLAASIPQTYRQNEFARLYKVL